MPGSGALRLGPVARKLINRISGRMRIPPGLCSPVSLMSCCSSLTRSQTDV
jgi:hypothetical protein